MEIIEKVIGGIFSVQAAQFILSLSFLIVLHELGHFVPAKLFKIRVEKFYLFFDPWFSAIKFKFKGTEYGIGWIPLGGYVKISGMIDESMDKEQMEKPPEDWEFRSKPAWQRLIVMAGGVAVNIVLAMMIYAMTLFVWGENVLPNKNVTDGIWCVDPLAKEIGFQTGDKVLSVDGVEIQNFSDIMLEVLTGKEAQVERNGSVISVPIPEDFISKLIDKNTKTTMFLPRMPFLIGDISEGSGADKGGLLKKDSVVSINGIAIKYFDELKPILLANKGKEVGVVVSREGGLVDMQLSVSDTGTIGFIPAIYKIKELERMNFYQFNNIEYSFAKSIPGGINKAIDKLESYIKQFKMIANPNTGAYKGVGGFAAIGSLFPAEWNWQIFWEMTGFLSVVLAFMNILPIPALDGGHVMFLLYEIIVRRKPNEKFMEYAQMAGMLLLLAVMLLSNGNDIFKLFK